MRAADLALEQARAHDKGWHRDTMEAAARDAVAQARPGWSYDDLHLVLVDDRPGIEEDRAHFVAMAPDDQVRVILARDGDTWVLAEVARLGRARPGGPAAGRRPRRQESSGGPTSTRATVGPPSLGPRVGPKPGDIPERTRQGPPALGQTAAWAEARPTGSSAAAGGRPQTAPLAERRPALDREAELLANGGHARARLGPRGGVLGAGMAPLAAAGGARAERARRADSPSDSH